MPHHVNLQTSNISRLPNETLFEIFEMAVGSPSIHDKFEEGARVAITLSHVCARWYNIATHLETLWTIFKAKNLRGAAFLRESLKRSGNQPLDIRLEFDTVQAKLPYYDLWNVFIELGSGIHRCRHLSVSAAPNSKQVFEIMRKVSNIYPALPLLESLRLEVRILPDLQAKATLGPSLTLDIRRLRDIHLDHVYCDFKHHETAPAGFASLRSLFLQESQSPWLEHAMKAPGLTILTLAGVHATHNTTFLNFESLTHLTIHSPQSSSVFNLPISANGLRSLEIGHLSRFHWKELIRYLNRPANLGGLSAVHSLLLTGVELPELDWSVVTAFPSISHMLFRETNAYYVQLFLNQHNDAWPLLSLLTIDGRDYLPRRHQ